MAPGRIGSPGGFSISRQPNDQWDPYDLATLHEATHEWDKAEIEIKEAIRINAKEKQFTDELCEEVATRTIPRKKREKFENCSTA